MTERLRREARKVKITNIMLLKQGVITGLACIKMIIRLYEFENSDEIEMFLEKHNN